MSASSAAPVILLVHPGGPDCDRIRELVSATTQPHFELRCATDASSALALAGSSEVACVLLDSEISGGDASPVLDSLGARTRHGPPVIVQLPTDTDEAILKALSHGARDYLVRGAFELQGFLRCIRSVIERDSVTRERNQLIADLHHALELVRRLTGIHTVCAHCRKLRDADGAWVSFERYIAERTDAEFSHGICPHCAEAFYGESLTSPAPAEPA